MDSEGQNEQDSKRRKDNRRTGREIEMEEKEREIQRERGERERKEDMDREMVRETEKEKARERELIAFREWKKQMQIVSVKERSEYWENNV